MTTINPTSSEPGSGDFSKDLALETAKQLPVKDVYNDGLSGSMKELGRIAENVLKTVHLAMFPIQVGAVLQERFSQAMRRAAERVPFDDRVEPAPQILGPVLEALKYEPEGTPLDEMYSELLSRSFDRNRAWEAHTAFVQIIKQLQPVEASLLEFIASRQQLFEEDLRQGDQNGDEISLNELWVGTGIEGNRFVMASHLLALGLLEVRDLVPTASMAHVKNLDSLIRRLDRLEDQLATRIYSISPFGTAFLMAVRPSTQNP